MLRSILMAPQTNVPGPRQPGHRPIRVAAVSRTAGVRRLRRMAAHILRPVAALTGAVRRVVPIMAGRARPAGMGQRRRAMTFRAAHLGVEFVGERQRPAGHHCRDTRAHIHGLCGRRRQLARVVAGRAACLLGWCVVTCLTVLGRVDLQRAVTLPREVAFKAVHASVDPVRKPPRRTILRRQYPHCLLRRIARRHPRGQRQRQAQCASFPCRASRSPRGPSTHQCRQHGDRLPARQPPARPMKRLHLVSSRPVLQRTLASVHCQAIRRPTVAQGRGSACSVWPPGSAPPAGPATLAPGFLPPPGDVGRTCLWHKRYQSPARAEPPAHAVFRRPWCAVPADFAPTTAPGRGLFAPVEQG